MHENIPYNDLIKHFVHKCRVSKDRWRGFWIVKCYYSDEYIGSYATCKEARDKAIMHLYGIVVDRGFDRN